MPSLSERLQLGRTRGDSSSATPLTAIEAGWSVVDSEGAPIGTVSRLEGEPALGVVTAVIVSVGAFSPDRRIAIEHVHTAQRGVVRLAVTCAELESA